MNGKEILHEMLAIWAHTYPENPLSPNLLKSCQPTSQEAKGYCITSQWTKGNTPEQRSKNRIAFLRKYAQPRANASFIPEDWQIKASEMTETQARLLAEKAGVPI